jgi:hypothetical protein
MAYHGHAVYYAGAPALRCDAMPSGSQAPHCIAPLRGPPMTANAASLRHSRARATTAALQGWNLRRAPDSLRLAWAGAAPDALGLMGPGRCQALQEVRAHCRAWLLHATGPPISSTRTSRRSLCLCCELPHCAALLCSALLCSALLCPAPQLQLQPLPHPLGLRCRIRSFAAAPPSTVRDLRPHQTITHTTPHHHLYHRYRPHSPRPCRRQRSARLPTTTLQDSASPHCAFLLPRAPRFTARMTTQRHRTCSPQSHLAFMRQPC